MLSLRSFQPLWLGASDLSEARLDGRDGTGRSGPSKGPGPHLRPPARMRELPSSTNFCPPPHPSSLPPGPFPVPVQTSTKKNRTAFFISVFRPSSLPLLLYLPPLPPVAPGRPRSPPSPILRNTRTRTRTHAHRHTLTHAHTRICYYNIHIILYYIYQPVH